MEQAAKQLRHFQYHWDLKLPARNRLLNDMRQDKCFGRALPLGAGSLPHQNPGRVRMFWAMLIQFGGFCSSSD